MYKKISRDLKFDTSSVAMMGTLIAIEIVLSRFASISAWNIKAGFSFVPIAIAAMILGPVKGGIVGAVADFIGAVLFPIGAYFPGFTLTAFLTGAIYGIFFREKQSLARIAGAVVINELILSLFLNTLWISVLYGASYWPLFFTRILQCAFLIPLQLCTIYLISKSSIGKITMQMYR
ncbi:MAG: folate family ECF transporter S component [Sedimentibacter sp.]|uniref:folate family ECF transporter S component n=1 Tax=Sedimentibacter sp. TaxID=1960295 RepID=UPI0029812A8B|nr:folate family ECF transporter S component [Sedimentibacter sp.]MDW5300194.1 folate family ECF transporter S component [Sedimentibacter sp.]